MIGKPGDPTPIAGLLRGHAGPADSSGKLSTQFLERLRSDAVALAGSREMLSSNPASSMALAELLTCAHKLAGAAGVFGVQSVSCAASALEESIIDKDAGRDTPGTIDAQLNRLIDCLERELSLYP